MNETQKARGRAKKVLRLVLDFVLMLLLITIFGKNAVNLMYHEVVGLVLLGLILAHLIANRKWIAAAFRSFRGKTARQKLLFAVNLLLIFFWLSCIVLGILVSKKIFHFNLPGSLIPRHFFTAALALLFTGLHIGLNWRSVCRRIAPRVRVPKAVTALILAVLLVGGGISFAVSDFGSWIAAPFQTSASMQHAGPPARSAHGHAQGRQGGHHGEPFSGKRLAKVLVTDFFMIGSVGAAAWGGDTLLRKKE